MDIDVDEASGSLARFAQARSWQSRRPIAALALDDGRPVSFVADEVIVDAGERELIARLTGLGGRIVRDASDPGLPEEFRRAGVGRPEPVDPTGLPRSVKFRFDRLPDARDVNLGACLDRAGLAAGRIRYSDPAGLALSQLIAPMLEEGRGVWLNEVGVDHHSLPLYGPAEGAGLLYSADPTTWPAFSGPSRIADAWQLIETLRLARSAGGGPVFMAIVDSGFWFDAPSTPGSGGAQALADLGTGLPRWNTVDDVAGIPTGPGRTTYHGTMVASSAAAAVGNVAGAAGSGGSVARACYFYDDRSADSAKTAMIRCTQWGIPFVVYSGGFTSVEFFFGTSAWNDTFNWAADNGVLMIASAGNDNISLPDDSVLRPATRTPRALTVGALNDDGTKAGFSNYGSSVGLWAPGVNIPVVPTPMSLTGSLPSGTSFSAPLVAGVAAMMRYANPALSVDQLRDTLVTAGWDGAGPGGKGLDAYAAVWAAMSARMAETATESAPERLFPRADGTFEPIFNSAINRTGDRDEFLLDIASFSTLQVDLQWYDRLSRVSLLLESTDPNAVDPSAAVTAPAGAGTARLTAELGSGRYRLVVRGSGPSAYLLSGRIRPGTLAPDPFEANDTFDTATHLRVVRPAGAPDWVSALFEFGPGFFPLTLHSLGAGPATADQDYFRVNVPADVGALRIPQVVVGSDEEVDVTLYDDARGQLFTNHARSTTLGLQEGRTYYVRVSGPTHTRYTLWVGANLNADALRRSWQEELHILPDWWEDVHPDWFSRPEEFRGVVIGEDMLRDHELVLGDASTGVLPESVHVELLDDAGELVRAAANDAGRRTIDVAGLTPGPYVVRVTSDHAGPFALTVQPPARYR
ncbi:S8 family serine peptidase [Arthrobacter sp. PM3]|uniref:S8 family peptidase n=1 Tax=Arthrobacter sp. PM3 TaxID=2017685 RepID=UPI000E101C64|nr:S8 family serine peptidase [Arthrobacter sp. PM3]AXJ09948.1 hypothetical protein CFN17_10165 [Arthrobacter sp. PM3]